MSSAAFEHIGGGIVRGWKITSQFTGAPKLSNDTVAASAVLRLDHLSGTPRKPRRNGGEASRAEFDEFPGVVTAARPAQWNIR